MSSMLPRTAALCLLMAGSMIALSGVARAEGEGAKTTTLPDAPPLPKITSISAQPASLTLSNGHDARAFLVMGQSVAGYPVDLTPIAKVSASSPIVRVEEDGYVYPV